MMPALLMAASMTVLSFGEGRLTLTAPANVRVQKRKLNFETEEYDLYDPDAASPLLQIVDGGGAYDLHTFTTFCLNGRQAWRDQKSDSGTVVVGEPGVSAVAAYWDHLSGSRLDEAEAIVSSIRIDFGARC